MTPQVMFDRQTILLIDDNDDDVFIMRSTFKKAGVNNPLQIAANGEEAIAYLKGEAQYSNRQLFPFPIVAFLDLNMPKKNGLEVLAWIRQESPCKTLTVHILTASTRPIDVERAFELGANSYLIKPSRMEGLVELVKLWHGLARFSAFPCSPDKG